MSLFGFFFIMIERDRRISDKIVTLLAIRALSTDCLLKPKIGFKNWLVVLVKLLLVYKWEVCLELKMHNFLKRIN